MNEDRRDDANLDSDASGLRELEEMTAELLHPAGEQLDIADSLQAFDQDSGPVVDAHPGYYLHGETKAMNFVKL